MSDHQTYLITGASRGIGFATARLLANAPNHRVLALARSETRLQELCTTNVDGQLDYLVFDLEQPKFDPLHQWINEHGPIHGLLNNAGLLINKPFADLSDDDWQRLFQVNVLGPAKLIRFLLPHFAPKSTHILNVGSMGGFQGSSKFPGLSAYSSAKAALANLTECLAEEFSDQGISVNCLALGAVRTEMLASAFPGYEPPMDAETMARLVVYFLQQGHLYFNGKVLPVSAGTP